MSLKPGKFVCKNGHFVHIHEEVAQGAVESCPACKYGLYKFTSTPARMKTLPGRAKEKLYWSLGPAVMHCSTVADVDVLCALKKLHYMGLIGSTMSTPSDED